jgi:hypothetical protein
MHKMCEGTSAELAFKALRSVADCVRCYHESCMLVVTESSDNNTFNRTHTHITLLNRESNLVYIFYVTVLRLLRVCVCASDRRMTDVCVRIRKTPDCAAELLYIKTPVIPAKV